MKYSYIENLSIRTFDPLINWKGKNNPLKFFLIGNTFKEEPSWFISSIKLSNNPIGLLKNFNSNASAGTSIYKEEALIRSLGEALERYCLTNYFKLDKKHYRYIDESKNFVRCADFEDSPPSFKKNGIIDKIEHSEVINLYNGTIDYLPFEYIHLGHYRNKDIGEYICSVSTGCSFFPNKEIAILKAIYEVLERDTLMKFWYLNFHNSKKINTNNIIDFDLYERIKRINNKNLVISLFYLENEFNIPVILSVISSDKFPYYCCGVSCDNNPIKASTKAIDEAMSIRVMSKWNEYKNESIDVENFNWINKLEDHMNLYANWKNSPIMQKLIDKSINEINITDIPYNKNYDLVDINVIKEICNLFYKKGYDIYYKDITLEEVKSMGYVIKVVIPKMIPLSQSYKSRWLSQFIDNNIKKEHINPFPQPFS